MSCKTTHTLTEFSQQIPDLVADAKKKKIEQLSYAEANELANLGTTRFYAKNDYSVIRKEHYSIF
jgi:hypothetical protein